MTVEIFISLPGLEQRSLAQSLWTIKYLIHYSRKRHILPSDCSPLLQNKRVWKATKSRQRSNVGGDLLNVFSSFCDVIKGLECWM